MKVVPKPNKIGCNIKFQKGFCSLFVIRILIPWSIFLGCFNVSYAFYYASPFLIENFQLLEVRIETNIIMPNWFLLSAHIETIIIRILFWFQSLSSEYDNSDGYQAGAFTGEYKNSKRLVEDKIENRDIFDLFSPGSSIFKFHPKHQMENSANGLGLELPGKSVLKLNDAVNTAIRNLKRSGVTAKKVIY